MLWLFPNKRWGLPWVLQIIIFEWCVIRCGSRNRSQKDIMCWKEIGLGSEYIWGNLCDLLRRQRNFTLWMNKMFLRALSIMRKVAKALTWICQSSCTNHVFHILREVGAELKVFILGLPTLLSCLILFLHCPTPPESIWAWSWQEQMWEMMTQCSRPSGIIVTPSSAVLGK